MHLQGLRLRNFKAFVECDVELPRSGLVFVVGANNAGKSALFSALDVVAGLDRGGRIDRVGAAEPAEISTRFALTEDDRAAVFEGSPHIADWSASQAFAELELRFRRLDAERALLREVRATDPRGDLVAIGSTEAHAGDGSLTHAALDIPELCKAGPDVAFNMKQLGTSTNADFLPWGAGLDVIGRLFKEWRDRFLHYAWTRLRIGESGPSVAVADLDPSGHNLPQFLLYLNTNRTPAWDEIRTVMSSVVPELGSIQTPVSGDQVRIEFGSPDLGATFNLRDHGTSVEQLLMITCLVTHLPAGGIAVIEEPETNLDPSTQRRLAAQLVEWASTRLLVVSTHSGELLEAAAGDALTLRVERAAGASTVRAVTEALERQRA